jgi:hypothetical protein
METRAGPEHYMMITLKGRFKGEVDSRWHVVPISNRTRSNIPFRLWMERIVYMRVKLEGRGRVGFLRANRMFELSLVITTPSSAH